MTKVTLVTKVIKAIPEIKVIKAIPEIKVIRAIPEIKVIRAIPFTIIRAPKARRTAFG